MIDYTHRCEWNGTEYVIVPVPDASRFQAALDRAWFALKPRKPTWWERLLRVLVWP